MFAEPSISLDQCRYFLVAGELVVDPYQILVSGLIPAFFNVICVLDSYPLSTDVKFSGL